MKNIFLIGPASVGKSTTAELLAKKLNCLFVDIDSVFCEEIGLIREYLDRFGYESYCEANSNLVDDLMKRHADNTVFATPAGYLVHESSPHLVSKHLEIINNKVTSVLLLPSRKPEDSVGEIVRRQLERWSDLAGKAEREKNFYIERFHKYKRHGHIKIFSKDEPSAIADEIVVRLKVSGLI